MKLKLERPLVFFDLETTGLDTKTARIVEIAMIKVFPDKTNESFLTLVNPEIPIPKEVTDIHGINNFDVMDKPTFKEIAVDVLSVIKNCDLAGYNLISYDVPILINELQRADISYSTENIGMIDVMKIFKIKERRDLSSAYRFYCKKDLDGAHSALKDTQATLDVLMAQTEKYEDLPQTVEELQQFCNQTDDRYVDPDRKLKWEKDEAHFTFGKYRGQNLKDISKKDPEYLQWIIKQDFSNQVQTILQNALSGIYPEKKNTKK